MRKMGNLDLFRGTLLDLDQDKIVKALAWLRGEGDFPRPTSIHLDLTLRCTGRCRHCRQWSWPAQPEFSLAQLERLLATFEAWGVATLTLGGGNPLLHPHFEAALKMAHLAHFKIGIITEGLGMPDRIVDAVCEHASWIRFSLDGPQADIHDAIRNAPGLFERVIEDIAGLRRRTSRLQIGLNCVIQKANIRYLAPMPDLAHRLKVDTLLLKLPHGDDPQGVFLPDNQDWDAFETWLSSAKTATAATLTTNLAALHDMLAACARADLLSGRPVRAFYAGKNVRCFAPFFFMTCDSQGNMYPCDYLQADTRPWLGRYQAVRSQFCCGNVLNDAQQVLSNLEQMMLEIHMLPLCEYDECGCCTRFCQLNTALSSLDDQLKASRAQGSATIREYLSLHTKTEEGAGFF